jgi:hypothetical protein
MKKPATSARPAATNDRDALLSYLGDACADDPDLLATVHALAEADETDLLRLIRDFRDNVSGAEILQRHGPASALDERLRVIHRVYVDCARRVREQSERPVRARKCYEARMLARRDNYQAMLDDASEAMPADVRAAYEKLIVCAREKVPYEALPGRLGGDALAIQEQVLQLRQRFKEWTARRKVRAEGSAPGGVCDG